MATPFPIITWRVFTLHVIPSILCHNTISLPCTNCDKSTVAISNPHHSSLSPAAVRAVHVISAGLVADSITCLTCSNKFFRYQNQTASRVVIYLLQRYVLSCDTIGACRGSHTVQRVKRPPPPPPPDRFGPKSAPHSTGSRLVRLISVMSMWYHPGLVATAPGRRQQIGHLPLVTDFPITSAGGGTCCPCDYHRTCRPTPGLTA